MKTITNFHPHLYSSLPKTQTINHHIRRYLEAIKTIQEGETAIDIGCGSGYGTAIIALRTKQVIGIDSDGEGIEYAKKMYPFVKFYNKDISLLQKNYDHVIAFEVIDHLDRHTADKFFKWLELRCNKTFTFSISIDAKLKDNPIHEEQWDEDKIKEAIGGYFLTEFEYQDWETGDKSDIRKGMLIIKGKRTAGDTTPWYAKNKN